MGVPLAISWTVVKSRRLKKLNAHESQLMKQFASTTARDRAYQDLEKELVKRERQKQ